MRRIGVVAALLIALLFSVPAAANCEECSQYWYWQSNSWCKYCAPSYCGYFRCQIMYTGASVDYCWGGAEAGANECFTPGQGCIYEPSEHASNGTWRLKSFEVIKPAKPRELQIALRN